MSETTAPVTSERGFFDEAQYNGVLGWLLSTDHKRIGLMYFWCIVTFFCVVSFIWLLSRL